MAICLLNEEKHNINSNENPIELESITVNTRIESTPPPHISQNNVDETDFNINIPQPIDDVAISTPKITNNNTETAFIALKKHVKGKRKSTFCCIFSFLLAVVVVVVVLAPLSTKMIDDWQTYNNSTHTECKLMSKTHTNNTHNISGNYNCLYKYETLNGHNLNAKCGNKMHEYRNDECNGKINVNHICYFTNKTECIGTMINISQLQRNNNMFVVLLGFGVIFGIITIICSIYAILLIRKYGIYLSIQTIRNDDNKVFQLMKKTRENHERHTRRKRSHKKSKKSKRSKKKKLIEKHKSRHRKKNKRKQIEISQECDSILSSQFGSSTINSLHLSLNESTVHSQISTTL